MTPAWSAAKRPESGTSIWTMRTSLSGMRPYQRRFDHRVGGTPERLAALRAGRVQTRSLNPPTIFAAEKEGFRILANVSALPFQNVAPVATRRFIKEIPDVVRRYVKSQVEAVHLMKRDRKTGLRVFAQLMGGFKNTAVLEKSYDVSVTDDKLPRNQ